MIFLEETVSGVADKAATQYEKGDNSIILKLFDFVR